VIKPLKRPSQRDDLKKSNDEGGAGRPRHPSHEAHLSPQHEVEPALYYFNLRTESGLIEAPEGDTYPKLQVAREDALTKARDTMAEGNREGEDRRFGIMDRASQRVVTVAFAEAHDLKATR
jgi:hypothetical protein